MRNTEILRQLGLLLPRVHIIELELVLSLKNKIGLCLTINDIVKEYNSTQQNEDKVCDLLYKLCKNYFK